MAETILRHNADIVKGDELWLFIGTAEDAEKPICFSTQAQLSRTLNTQSISSKDHGNTSYVIPGEGSWTASTEALMSIADGEDGAYAFEKLMDLFYNSTKVWARFGKLSNYSDQGIVDVDVDGTTRATGWALAEPNWYGEAYITSLQATGGHGDSATFSVELTGVGPLKKKLTQQTTP